MKDLMGVPRTWDFSGDEGVTAVRWRNVAADTQTFRTKGACWQFGGMTVYDVLQTPYTVRHDHVPRAGEPARVSVLFVHAGTFTITDENTTITLSPGDTGWVKERSGLTILSAQTTRITVVSFPVQDLADAGVHLAHTAGTFSENSIITKPARAYLQTLIAALSAPDIGDADQPSPVTDALGCVITALFLEHQDSAPRTVQNAGLHSRAVALIRRQSTDPSLTPSRLAEELNVSVRHLQRAFHQNHHTIADTIRAYRLASVTTVLNTPRPSRPLLSQIAAQAGFSSLKELRHALRAHTHHANPAG